jgi:hypothetical protein
VGATGSAALHISVVPAQRIRFGKDGRNTAAHSPFERAVAPTDASIEILAHSLLFRWRSANNSFSEATHKGGNDG